MPDGEKQPVVKPWNEIALTFDAMMLQETYDQLRKQYFFSFVAPKLLKEEPNVRPDIQFEEWKKHTERPKLLTPAQKMLTSVGIAATAGYQEILAPLTLFDERIKGEFERNKRELEVLKQLAEREGMNVGVPETFGVVAGAGLPIAATWQMAGPLTKLLGTEVLKAGRATEYLNRIARGGLAFGTYEALRDQEGDRLAAGLHGVAIGAAFEGAFGLPAFLKLRGLAKTTREAEDLARRTMEGKPVPPEVDVAVSEHLVEQAQVAKQSSIPSDYYRATPDKPGVRFVVKDNQQRILELSVKPEAEIETFEQAQKIVQSGGSFVRWEHGADDATRFKRAQALFQKMNEPPTPTVVRTPAGAAEQVAKKQGGVAIREDMVVLRPAMPKGFPSEEQVAKAFTEARINPADQPQLRRYLESVWDPNIPLANKTNTMELLRKARLQTLTPSDAQILELHGKTGATVQQQIKEAFSEAADLRQDELAKKVVLGEITATAAVKRLTELVTSGEKALEIEKSFMRRVEALKAEPAYQPAEISRLEEIVQKGKQAGRPVGARGPEPKVPLAKATRASVLPAGASPLVIPPSEQYRVNIKPARAALIAPTAILEKILPGAEGFVIRDLEGTVLERIVPRGHSPWMVLADNATKGTVYHEGVHYNLARTGLDLEELLLSQLEPGVRRTAADLTGGLGDMYRPYRSLPPYLQTEEAFVHAAEAVRFGAEERLAFLGKLDAGVDSVVEFVNKSAQQIRDAIYPKLNTLNARILERQMNDLIRRSSKDVSFELRKAAQNLQVNAYYDQADGMWKLIDERGEQQWFKTGDEFWDYVDGAMKLGDTAADASFWAQLRGARGPLVPPGHEPTNRAPSMELPPKRGWAGLSALTAWLRPTGPWVAGVQKKLEAAMGKSLAVDLYGPWRKVDEAVGAAEAWNRGMLERASDILQGSGNKVHDYFQALTYKPEQLATAQKVLKLDAKDMSRIEALRTWMNDYQSFTRIPVWDYLQRLYPNLRSFGFESDMVFGKALSPSSKVRASFWDDAIRYQAEWDPKEDHVGKFMNFLLRKGVDKMFIGEPLEELQKLINTKTKDGSYFFGPVKNPLQNYVNYVKGIPDMSTRAMNDAAHAFEGSLSKRLGELSRRVPGLPKDFKLPTGLFSKMMIFSYAAGLGGRPSIVARDAFTVVMTGLPVLGPGRFLKALAQLGKESYEEANAAGALLRRNNIGELYGDITQELGITSGRTLSLDGAVRVSNALLQPTRWGNNVGRTLVYRAGRTGVEEAVPLFRAGKIDSEELLNRTSMWFADDPVINKFLKQAADKEVPIADLAHSTGRELVDLTQWPYRRGTQPALLRTGIGRIMGQYGYWPANYVEYIRRLAVKAPRYRTQALQAMALWSAVNYASVEGMAAIGADTNNWFWTSPMAYGGGPHFDFALNLMKSSDNTQQGREARKRVLQYPLNFIPASVELRAIMHAQEAREAIPGPGLWRVMGFRPMKELEKDKEFLDWIRYQAGLGTGRY